MRILVDLDGVVVDWTSQFEGDLVAYYPHLRFEMMREFSTPTHLSQEHQDAINWVKYRPGFYREMGVISGAYLAINEMKNEGHDVWFCSSPEINNPTCASDKVAWLHQHFGEWWANRLILTRDKTLVRGHILIDDRPDVNGVVEPEWTHVLFDQPYNDHVNDKIRLNDWDDWRYVVNQAVAV